MSLAQLKARRWMAARPLILVGSGLLPPDDAAAELKSAGFQQVSVLQGGLYGHFLAGGKLVGNVQSGLQLAEVTISRFAAAVNRHDWFLADLAADESSPSPEEFMSFATTEDTAVLRNRIRDLVAQKNGQYLLLVDQYGEHRDLVLHTLKELGDARVFYLQGGKEAWHRHAQPRDPKRHRARHKTASQKQLPKNAVKTKSSCGCNKKKHHH